MPLARHDPDNLCSICLSVMFLLTCLLRGMTFSFSTPFLIYVFLLTCLLRGITPHVTDIDNIHWVYTHMPLAMHDLLVPLGSRPDSRFYSHASCEAWPWFPSIFLWQSTFLLTCLTCSWCRPQKFLLTCLLRGMTSRTITSLKKSRFLLTCLLRGMTSQPVEQPAFGSYISTHMPLARHDRTIIDLLTYPYISTHMPLARHDSKFN